MMDLADLADEESSMMESCMAWVDRIEPNSENISQFSGESYLDFARISQTKTDWRSTHSWPSIDG